MKMLLKLHYRTPMDDLHAMLNILKVNDMFKTNILSLVNRCLLDVPPVFYDYYKYQEVNYDLRLKRLEVPRFRNNYGMFRVAVQGAALWINIPDTLSCFTVKKCFKEHVVKHYIGIYTNQWMYYSYKIYYPYIILFKIPWNQAFSPWVPSARQMMFHAWLPARWAYR